jgi:hypothetical protein
MGNGNSIIKHATQKNIQQYCGAESRILTTLHHNNQPTTIMISTITDPTIPRISNTLNPEQEVETINRVLDHGDLDIQIVIYGKNGNDETILVKYNQLNELGFNNVKLYIGGITEWLLLQEIFGVEMYPICRASQQQLNDHERMNFIIQLLD